MSLNRLSDLSTIISRFWSTVKCVCVEKEKGWGNEVCVEKEKGWGEGSHFGPESSLIQSFDCSVEPFIKRFRNPAWYVEIFCQNLILEMTASNKVIVYAEVNVSEKSHHSVYSR